MELIDHILAIIDQLGLFGLFLATFLMFAVFPLPSQLIVVANGFVASSGEGNFFIYLLAGTAGSFLGAIVNYLIGRSLGLKLILKYGEYIFITKKRIALLKLYFQKYGWISVLIGTSLPSIGQMITLPAGMGKMNINKFVVAAFFGSLIWNFYLLAIGYFFGSSSILIGSPNA